MWNTQELLDLVSRRLPVSEDDQKLKLKERNHDAYKKSTEDMRVLRAQLEGFVIAARMSQDEMDRVMLSRLHGQYRVKYREEIAERKRHESVAALQKEKAALDEAQEKYNQLEINTATMANLIKDQSKLSQTLTLTLAQMFNPSEYHTIPGHLKRSGFDWPTIPSVQAFYDLYAVSVPIGSWLSDNSNPPDINLAFQSASLALHPDKATQYYNALGGREKMEDIARTLQASKEKVVEFLAEKNGTLDEKNMFLNRLWECSKHKVLDAMRPNSTDIPPFFISWLVDDAASKLAKSQGHQQQS